MDQMVVNTTNAGTVTMTSVTSSFVSSSSTVRSVSPATVLATIDTAPNLSLLPAGASSASFLNSSPYSLAPSAYLVGRRPSANMFVSFNSLFKPIFLNY